MFRAFTLLAAFVAGAVFAVAASTVYVLDTAGQARKREQ